MKKITLLLAFLSYFVVINQTTAQKCPPVAAFTSFDYNPIMNTVTAEWIPTLGANNYQITLYLDGIAVQNLVTTDPNIVVDLSQFGSFSEGYISVVSDCNTVEPLISPIFTKEIVMDDISMRNIIKNGCENIAKMFPNKTKEEIAQLQCACNMLTKQMDGQEKKITHEQYEKILKENTCKIQENCKVNIVKRYCYTATEAFTIPQIVRNSVPIVNVTPNPSAFLFLLKWEMKQPETVSLFLYDSAGELLKILIENQLLGEGTQQYELDLSAYPEGIYYYQLLQGKEPFSGKLIKLE